MPKYSKETLEQVKKINLLHYMMNCEPNNLVKKGRDYCTKEHDSLIISPNGKWNWSNSGFGGSTALQYLIKVKGLDFRDAVKTLLDFEPTNIAFQQVEKGKPKKSFTLPKINFNGNNKAISYLLKRGIDRSVIDYCISEKSVYEEYPYHNTVFVGYDKQGIAKYAFKRGEYMKDGTLEQFMGEVTGSDKRHSFSITPKVQSNQLIVSESAIDLLSLATLHGDIGRVHYLSVGGVYAPKGNTNSAKIPLALEQYLKDHPDIEQITLCLDNDKTGIGASFHYAKKLMDRYEVDIELPSGGKDYNEILNR